VRLFTVDLEAFFAGAERKVPIGAHLQIVVERFRGVVVECVFRAPDLLRPEQGLVGIGEAHTAKVGHGIIFDPRHIVEDPVVEVLQDLADAVDVVIRADDPQCAGVFQDPAATGEPGVGEPVVLLEVVELVPVVVHRIDVGLIGTPELLLELQVVGRVGKYQVDRGLGELAEQGEAIAGEDLVEGQMSSHCWISCYFLCSVIIPFGESWSSRKDILYTFPSPRSILSPGFNMFPFSSI
jgi:hypothetical protein